MSNLRPAGKISGDRSRWQVQFKAHGIWAVATSDTFTTAEDALEYTSEQHKHPLFAGVDMDAWRIVPSSSPWFHRWFAGDVR